MRRLVVLGYWFCLILATITMAENEYRGAADRPVDVQHLRLDLEVFLEERRIAGSEILDFTALRPVSAITLDAVNIEIASVELIADGAPSIPVKFDNTGKELVIPLGRPMKTGDKSRLVIRYQVRDPKAGLYFFGPTVKDPDTPLTVWSQGEAIGNRHWFPCFDNPNERQTTEIVATVPSGNEVLSNGVLVSREDVSGGKTKFHWKQAEPHAAYLVTLVVGKFKIGKEEFRGKPVLYYVPEGRAADTRQTFGRTTEMLQYFSRRFGVEYPWPKYAQVVVEQFIMGGMENTSATTLTENVMHDDQAMMDGTPDWLIAHELGHQWWGDLLTCKDWSHLWLNEGFATYCEALWAEHKLGADEFHLVLSEKSAAAREGPALSRPIVDHRYVDPQHMFDNRAYPKGAWVLHMLRSQLGDQAFFAGLTRYCNDFRFQTVETSDLRIALERQSGQSLERFFFDWTERPGHPKLHVATEYLANDKKLKLTIKQTQAGEPFAFPLRIEAKLPEKNEPIRLDHRMKSAESVVYLSCPANPELTRVDPQFTILCEIEEEKSRQLWVEQLRHGPTVPERMRAAKHFGKSQSTADRELLADALVNEPFHGVAAAIARGLAESGGDVSRSALIKGLAHAHPKTRRACAEGLAKFPNDSVAIAALADKLKKPEESYQTLASSIGSLAQILDSPKLADLQPMLDKHSHRDVIRRAALAGIGRSTEPAAFELLLDWSKLGRPRECRAAAITALGVYASRNQLPVERESLLVHALVGYFQNETPLIRRAAVKTLRGLGKKAQPSLEALRGLADHDADSRVRDLANSAIEKIHSESPAAAELTRLRDELERIRKNDKSIEDRVLKLEGKGK